MWDVDLDEVVGAWPTDDELVHWFRLGHAALVEALEAAPPDLQCWTFLPAPTPLAMWARRQAHETAIHRVDTELAAGTASAAFTPAFAADGVDELLTCFVPRRSATLRVEQPAALAVCCSDHDAAWVLRLGPDGVTVERAAAATAATEDCTVRGTAADLYLALWNRAGPEALVVGGDTAVAAPLLDSVSVRWA